MAAAHSTQARARRTGEGTENYAKAIYHLQQRGDGAAHTGAIAERVGVTPASASAMVRRMAEDGLLEQTPYHGDPIPTAELEIDEPDTRRLSDMEPGDRGTLVRISDSDPAMLRYLAELGVSPGDAVHVVDRQPFGGPLTIRFPNGERALGGAVTEAMRVAVK